MSDAARDQVWRSSHHKGSTFIVALAVADVVNDTYGNEFFMHIESLAIKTRLSVRSVIYSLEELVKDGWLIEVESGVGRGNMKRYRWHFIDDLPIIFDTKRKPAKSAPNKNMQSTTENMQSTTKRKGNTNLLLTERTEQMFNLFWSVYPRRDNKKQAQLAFAKACKTNKPETIIEAAKKFASVKREIQFTPMAATWLNQCRFEDEVIVVAETLQTATPLRPKFDPKEFENPDAVPMPSNFRDMFKKVAKGDLSHEQD